MKSGAVRELVREKEEQGDGSYAKVGGIKISTRGLESRRWDRGDR